MIPHNAVRLTADDKAAVMRVLDSGQIGQGPEVVAFEQELAERFRPGGAAACVSSGTAALYLAQQLLPTRAWIPTYACSALYHAMSHNWEWAPPKLFDCEPGTLNTPQATVIVHTYGVPCPVAEDTIEDFTHAVGIHLDGKPCGSMGALSVISFGATKPLGCGSGGAVLGTSDLIAAIKDMRDYDGKRDLQDRFNWQWSDVGAAIGRSRLRRLDDENAWRSQVAACYDIARKRAHDRTRGWYRYVIQLERVAEAKARFAQAGIETIVPLESWELLHRQLHLPAEDFPNAEIAARTTLSLPIWPGMSNEDVDRVSDVLAGLEDLL